MSAAPPLRIVVDNREDALIAALTAYLKRYNAAAAARKAPPLAFTTVSIAAGGVAFLRADGTAAYACTHDALSRLEALLDDDKNTALAIGVAARAAARADGATWGAGAAPVTFSVEQLPVSDYVLRRSDAGATSALVGERKAVTLRGNDIAASVGDARYRSQKESMLALRERDDTLLEYLFEVPRAQRGFMDPACFDAHYGGTRMGAATLRGVVANTAARDDVATPFAENAAETACHIVARYLAVSKFDPRVGSEPPAKRRATRGAALRRDAAESQLVVSKAKKRRLDDATPLTLFADSLRAVPLVGDKGALAIARHFASPAALCAALPRGPFTFPADYKRLVKELGALFEGVDDVGPKTALAIYGAMNCLDAASFVAPPKKTRAPAPAPAPAPTTATATAPAPAAGRKAPGARAAKAPRAVDALAVRTPRAGAPPDDFDFDFFTT